MLSKSRKKLRTRKSGNLGLEIHNNQCVVKETLTHREINLKATSPSQRKRRVTGRQRRKLGSSATSKKSLGITSMNVT
jgi:hypothetical protein